ncbi:L-methionine/branched-chain amino acid transporter [Phaeospirillum tilakii]|uniref:L-methionine/branched-chain amino acid transporter n=1 Tax=Phaeospirillum tilakii TaxID=741673 RepID=A0ABW5CAY2_9PROT
MSDAKGGLRLHQGIGFLISALLGSGVFIVPAIVASISGYYSWLPWVAMTVLMLPVLFVFSWLGKAHPHAAGTAHFVRLAFGDRISRSISILYLSVIPVGPPVLIVTGASYLAFCFGLDLSSVPYLCFVMLGLILAINFFHISMVGNIQFALTAITALILGLVIYAGLFVNETGFRVFDEGARFDLIETARSMGVIFWCFVGIEAVAHIAPDFRNPERDFPRTVSISILVTILLYGLLCYSVLNYAAFGSEEKNIASLPTVISQSFGAAGSRVIGFVGFVTCLGAVNLYIVSFARLLTSLSEEGAIPRLFSTRNDGDSPIVAILLVVMVIALTIVLKFSCDIKIEKLLSSANGIFISIYLMASLSSLRLLPKRNRPLGVVASAVCLLVAVCLWSEMIYAAAVLALSLGLTSGRALGRRAPGSGRP